VDDQTRASTHQAECVRRWAGPSMASSDLRNSNLLAATGDGRYTNLARAGNNYPVDFIPRVKRCKVHQIVDCFDCGNPVQSTQTNPQFECVEVPNGHE
jgi:hypothetical protein